MKTVQLAIPGSEYAKALRSLLVRDGTHRVCIVERPDLRMDGVIVIDGSSENLSLLESHPERFLVVTQNGSDNLSIIWKAGARHVVFEKDPPHTAQLAIIATELQLDDEFTPHCQPCQVEPAGTLHRLRVH